MKAARPSAARTGSNPVIIGDDAQPKARSLAEAREGWMIGWLGEMTQCPFQALGWKYRHGWPASTGMIARWIVAKYAASSMRTMAREGSRPNWRPSALASQTTCVHMPTT